MPSASRPSRNSSAETEAPTASVRSTLRARHRLLERRADPVHLLLGRRLGRCRGQPDQHLVGGAEALHALLADVLAGERRADLGEIGGTGRADLHHDAAREVDAEIEARVEEQHRPTQSTARPRR